MTAHKNSSKKKKPQTISAPSVSEGKPIDGVSRLSRFTWIPPGLMAVYFFLFLFTRFEPLESLLQEKAYRFEIFLFFAARFDPLMTFWFGPSPSWQWTPFLYLILMAIFCVVAAFSTGLVILRGLQLSRLLTRCEQFVLGTAAGLNVYSTLLLLLGLFGQIRTIGFWLIAAVMLASVPAGFMILRSSGKKQDDSTSKKERWLLLIAVPSLLILLFGSVLPPIEYDVVSYHLPGVKEFYESGRIGFMPHNVYTNMPFGAEMFALWGMILTGDWYTGALVGKLLIGFTTFLTALGLYTFGKRLGSTFAAVAMFVVYLSIPWVIWITTAGLIDGVVGMSLFMAVYLVWLVYHLESTDRQKNSLILLVGIMAGSAAACKYTSLLFVVVPVGLMLIRLKHISLGKLVLLFSIGALLGGGLWYLKNFILTGNPTYPLLYGIFGDATGTWNEAKNIRWSNAHHAHDFSLSALLLNLRGFFWESPWLAPIVAPFVLFSVFLCRKNRFLSLLLGYVAFYFVFWWFFTHRLDRFFLPLFPVLVMLVGMVLSQWDDRRWKTGVIVFLVLNMVYVFLAQTLPAPGKYTRFGLGGEAARNDPERVLPLTRHFNENPPQGKLLLIGEAKVFDFAIPVLYSTCFDDTVFDEIVKNKPPEEMRREFHERGITDILVDWGELQRFRSPGNYGYSSEIVTEAFFNQLVRDGLLVKEWSLSNDSQSVYRVL